jgi:hypothetical protein
MRIISVLVLGLVLPSACLFERGNMDIITYRTIFTHSSSGEFIIANMDNNYRVRKLQTIDLWLNRNRNTPFNEERHAERILGLLKYEQITIQISVYSSVFEFQSFRGHDIYFIDRDGNQTILPLGFSEDRQSELAFAKIIDNTLFVGLNEPFRTTNIIKVMLDREEYSLVKYILDLGVVQDIWVRNDGRLILTTNNDNKLESFVVDITRGDTLEIIEQLDYSIVGYDALVTK